MIILLAVILVVLAVKLIFATINGMMFIGCKSYRATVKELRGVIPSEVTMSMVIGSSTGGKSKQPISYTQVYEVIVMMDGEERHFSVLKTSTSEAAVRQPGQVLRVLYHPQENRMTEFGDVVVRPLLFLAGVVICLVAEYLLVFCNLGLE